MSRNDEAQRPPDGVIRAMMAASRVYVSLAECFLDKEAMGRIWADFEIGDGLICRDDGERAVLEQVLYGFWASVAL